MQLVDIFYLSLAISAIIIALAVWYIAFPLVRTLIALKLTIEGIREIVNDFNNIRKFLNIFGKFIRDRKDEGVK